MKHPLQIRVNEVKQELAVMLKEWQGAIPLVVVKEIEKHLAKLDVISDDLKEVQSNECPAWLTTEVIDEVKKLWDMTSGDRYTHRVEAAKLVIRKAEEAGYKIGLSKFDELRKKYC